MIGGGIARAGVLGLNARNADYIMRHNPRRRYPLVDDKILCKEVLLAAGLPVPPAVGVIRSNAGSRRLEQVLRGATEFAIKPARGSGGDGILVITNRRNRMWIGTDGQGYTTDDLQHHLTNVVSGLYSLGGQPDHALLEDLIRPDPRLLPLAPTGIPDIRIIVFRGFPVMAMTRLPTRRSHGKANLHQGAIGAGICLGSGQTTGGVQGNHRVDEHPDTGHATAGFPLPQWDQMVEMAAACYEAVGLGYLGVDLVLDRDRGPLVLELNARPGLNIQLANGVGLRRRLAWVERKAPADLDPVERARWSRRRFAVADAAPAAHGELPLDMPDTGDPEGSARRQSLRPDQPTRADEDRHDEPPPER